MAVVHCRNWGSRLTEPSFNALQAILIRERLILYMKHRRKRQRRFSLQKLIEAIACCEANANSETAYREDADKRVRGDSGYSLKHSTLDNLLARKTSALDAANLALISRFLIAEKFLSQNALALCARHPDQSLQTHFQGLAGSDPRLQTFRRAVEGEFYDPGSDFDCSLWIAAPGRSQPFVAVRASSEREGHRKPARRPIADRTGMSWNNDPKKLSEGRIFLMPNRSMTLVEMSVYEKSWDGQFYRIAVRDDQIALLNDSCRPRNYRRIEAMVAAEERDPDKEAPSALVVPLGMPGWGYEDRNHDRIQIYADSRADPLGIALIEAAKSGTAADVLELLIQGADINSVDPETGRTALHWATATCANEKVSILNCHVDDEAWVLRMNCPKYLVDADAIIRWRAARAAFYPLHTDNEGCFASALAPVSTDRSRKNEAAKDIWRWVFGAEWQAAHALFGVSPFAFLDVWKPSSIMKEAARERSAHLPRGFKNPKASFDLTELFRIR